MSKINPADAETKRYLDIQLTSAPITRFQDTLLISFCAFLVLFFGILIWLLPHADFSPDENRSLMLFPEFSLSSLTDGEYTSKVGKFYSDQFPLRKYFVGFKAVCELAQLKMQNNNVIPGKDGNLVKRLEYSDYSTAKNNLAAIADFSSTLDSFGIPLTVSFAPRSVDVLTSCLSPLFGSDRTDGIWSVIDNSGIDTVDLCTPLTLLDTNEQYVWYKTDHHWTTLGAYTAYTLLADSLDYTAKPLSYFTVEQASSEFFGTTFSSSGMRWTAPDTIDYYRYPGDENYIVKNMLTDSVINGFYDRSYLETKDKYSSFLGGNNAYITVTTSEKIVKPTLLIIKDSYAHSVAPFLAIHFNLVIIDLRLFNGSTASLSKDTGADAVLILIGADNLAMSDDLTMLRYGLSSSN